MKRSYRNPKKERRIQIIGGAVLVGIILGVLIDIWEAPIVYVKEAEAATTTPEVVEKAVMIEVVYSKEGIERLIRETFPEEPNTAVAVAKAESELEVKVNPEAHRNENGDVICYGSYGIMQIGCVHNLKDPKALKDVELNIKKARAIYDETKARTGNGWLQWGAYTDGRWKQYL